MKLSNNYYKYPIPRGGVPAYEDLYMLMIDLLLPVPNVAMALNVLPSSIDKYCRKLNIHRTPEQKSIVRKKTNIKLYGVTNKSQLPEFKEKVIQTSMKKYGVPNPNMAQCVKDKIIETNMRKYGVKRPAQLQEIKDRVKQKFMEKYGVESVNSLPEKIEKCKQTNIERYGNKCSLNGSQVRQKTIQNNLKKYGVEWPMQNKQIQEKSKQTFLKNYGTENISNAHLSDNTLKIIHNKDLFIEFLDKHKGFSLKYIAQELNISYEGLQYEINKFDCWDHVTKFITKAEEDINKIFPQFYKTRSILPHYEIDLYNDELKFGIEYNGNYWHSDLFLDKFYHQNKSQCAKDNGIFLYHIYEYEWSNPQKRNIILSQLNNLIYKNNHIIYGRNCQIQNIDYKTCHQFLNENHLQGSDKSSIRLGLFSNDKLFMVMTFCKPRFNKQYQYELSRLCTKCGYTIVGGASKLFNYFINNYKPTSVISYSNVDKCQGKIYPILGFNFVRKTNPNYIWFSPTFTKYLTRYQCQKHKLKEHSHLGNTEVEIMHNLGYHQLYDCGNYVWEYIQ